MSTTETETKSADAILLEGLREKAGNAVAEWFAEGAKQGLDPMMMAGQISADLQRLLA